MNLGVVGEKWIERVPTHTVNRIEALEKKALSWAAFGRGWPLVLFIAYKVAA